MRVLLETVSWKNLLGVSLVLGALSMTASYSYLLFHSLAELFSIAIACGIFFLAWNSRRYHQNDYLLFLGIAYLFVSFFDLLHTLAYKGMGVFHGIDDNNLPPQIWLVARYMEAASLLVAPIYLQRRIHSPFVLAAFGVLSTVALLSVFQWNVFPDCFLPGLGLTYFKILSEYVIIAMLLGAGLILVHNRSNFDPDVLRLLILAILCTIATEFFFTLYVNLYAASNLVGHLFKILSFWFMYRAIIVTGLTRPYDLLFRNLQQEIVERKRSEDALHQSELTLKATLDGLTAHIAMLDDQGTILLTNRAWRQFALQNGSAAETVSEGVNYIHVCDMAVGHSSQEASGFSEGIRSVLSGKIEAFAMEYPCDSLEQRRWFVGRVTLFPIDKPRRVIVAHEDITERKIVELELLKLRLGIENSTSTVVITDKDGVIEYVNPAFTVTTGYTPDEVIGKNPRVLKSGVHDTNFYTTMWQTLLAGNAWRGEISNRKKDGHLYWEQASISPIKDSDGNICNYVAVKDDITERKDLERIKDDVERIMRHDLKTPLNGIIGIPQILAFDDNLTDGQKELIKTIEDAGMRMLRMIDGSLDLFKMETGAYIYSPKLLDALVIFEQIRQQYKSNMSAKDITICLFVDSIPLTSGMSFMVHAAEGLLYSLLANLIANAVEASPKSTFVSVECSNQEPKVVTIRNRGAVPQVIRENFFEKYKTHGKSFGTGLGTYSAKLIADTMGYGIQMETSDEEDTTCVSISIPTLEHR